MAMPACVIFFKTFGIREILAVVFSLHLIGVSVRCLCGRDTAVMTISCDDYKTVLLASPSNSVMRPFLRSLPTYFKFSSLLFGRDYISSFPVMSICNYYSS